MQEQIIAHTIHGKYLVGENFGNHTGKSYWRGKIWQISNNQCICQIRFPCICEYWQGKFLANGAQLAKFAKFFLPKFFHVWQSVIIIGMSDIVGSISAIHSSSSLIVEVMIFIACNQCTGLRL